MQRFWIHPVEEIRPACGQKSQCFYADSVSKELINLYIDTAYGFMSSNAS